MASMFEQLSSFTDAVRFAYICSCFNLLDACVLLISRISARQVKVMLYFTPNGVIRAQGEAAQVAAAGVQYST